MGAKVYGYALSPLTHRDIYCVLDGDSFVRSTIADLSDRQALESAMLEADPDIVFHMAAQPLVRRSYQSPIETMMTNILGTGHVLEAMRSLTRVRAGIIVTSDKCYDNRETETPYREDDPMGGRDPYSMSKGAAGLVVSSFRKSFFEKSLVGIASVRSGNIYGGGDWSVDRIIPDFFRAAAARVPLRIRNPNAVRPWLYVLDSLSGYLLLARNLYAAAGIDPNAYAQGWNFGPDDRSIRTVRELINAFEGAIESPPPSKSTPARIRMRPTFSS